MLRGVAQASPAVQEGTLDFHWQQGTTPGALRHLHTWHCRGQPMTLDIGLDLEFRCTRCKLCYIDCCGHLPLDMSPRNSLFNEAATVKLKDVCLSFVLEVKSETAIERNALERKSKTVNTQRQSSWLDIQELVWAWERSLARRNSASHWKIVD